MHDKATLIIYPLDAGAYADARLLQADTVAAISDFLIFEAADCERENRVITFDDLKRIGKRLKEDSLAFAEAVKKEQALDRAVIRFPLNNKTEYAIPQRDVNYWQEMFPAIDVMQQLRKMHAWLDAHPKNRKTRGGIRAFIARWLAEEQDKAPRVTGAPAAAAKPAPAAPEWELPAKLGEESLAKSIWCDIRLALKNRLPPHTFDTWLKPTIAAGIAWTILYVKVPHSEFLHIEDKFRNEINAELPGLARGVTGVKFVAPKETA